MVHESPNWRRYLRLFGPDAEADIEDEVGHHVAALAEHYIARGLPPDEARTLAMRRFGNIGSVKTDCVKIAQRRRKAMARAELIDRFGQDVRFAVRTFARTPVFTVAALLTLALGIGANTAVFSVVNAVLLRPLPLGDPNGVISVWTRYVPESGSDFEFFSVAVPEYRDYKTATRALSDVAAYGFQRVNLADGGVPDRVASVPATANLFDVLRVQPVLGRTFRAGDDAAGAACVTVISDGLWRGRFAASSSVLGKTIKVDGRTCSVIGVMPAGFFFPIQDVQLWTPLALDADTDLAEERESHWISAVGRLADGATLEQAQAELTPMMAAWRRQYPHHKGHFIVLRPFREDLVGSERPVLVVMLGGVALVLLIICANLANLMLARAESRRREMAVRVAMGAGRGRLIRQLLTESLILSGIGGLAALGLAPLFLKLLARLDVSALPTVLGPVEIDAIVMMFTVLVSVVTGVAFGVIPAFQLSTLRLQETLKSEGRGTTGSRKSVAVRRILVVLEMSLALAVVVAASLLVQSYRQMQNIDLGFTPANALTMDVTLPEGDYSEKARVQRFYEELRARVSVLPGVRAVGLLSALPFRSGPPADDYRIEGRPDPEPGQPNINGGYVLATPGVFDALGIKLLRGRLFDERDVAGAPLAAVIDETAVKMHFGDRDPIGHRIRYYGQDSAWITVVGVVGGARYVSPRSEPRANVYVPHAQMPRRYYTGRDLTLIVRSERDPEQLIAGVRAAARELDATVPITRIATMDDIVSRATGRPRFAAGLMGLFGIIALLVGALGVYGILSYIVQSRANEIGIRMALGATARAVQLHVLGQGMALAGAGIALGTIAALFSSRLLAGMVYGVEVRDLPTYAVTIAVLGGAAFLASWLPARRATRVDPLAALRS